jgi:rhodanese-related sulfurtransferase
MKEVSPKEANDLLAKDTSAVLVDVRTVQEFQEGHPAKSLNVPIMVKGAFGMSPNPEFLAVISAAVPKGKKVFLSCRSGQRSARAAMIMEQNGWTDTTNVRCGFGGATDMAGNIVEPGWAACGLPVDKGDPKDRSYADLKKNVK